MTGYFRSSVLDLGKVQLGVIVNGRFELKEGVGKIRKCDGGCTCGGRPRISFDIDDDGFAFHVRATMVGGKRDIVRVITAQMMDGGRQILYVKYKV